MEVATNKRQDNANFARFDAHFRLCCELAKVKPTKRQASKFRRGEGRAYSMRLADPKQLNGKAVTS
jgi:hypothetical protein